MKPYEPQIKDLINGLKILIVEVQQIKVLLSEIVLKNHIEKTNFKPYGTESNKNAN